MYPFCPFRVHIECDVYPSCRFRVHIECDVYPFCRFRGHIEFQNIASVETRIEQIYSKAG